MFVDSSDGKTELLLVDAGAPGYLVEMEEAAGVQYLSNGESRSMVLVHMLEKFPTEDEVVAGVLLLDAGNPESIMKIVKSRIIKGCQWLVEIFCSRGGDPSV